MTAFAAILPLSCRAVERWRRCFAAMIVITCLSTLPAQADRLEQATALVTDLLSALDTKEVTQQTDRDKRHMLLSGLLETYFDVDGITRFTAGQYWRVATDQQKQEYSRLFKMVLISEANTRFAQISNLEFRPVSTEARGDRLILVTGIVRDITGEFPDAQIIWRMADLPDSELKIIDIELENISMLKTQQDENTALIRRSGGDFSVLIDAMHSRIAALETAASS